MVPVAFREPEGLAVAQRKDIWRKTLRPWHVGAIDKRRNNLNAPIECGADLKTNEVVRVLQAPTTVSLPQVLPSTPYEGNQRITGVESTAELSSEVHPRRHIVDVTEDAMRTQILTERVIKTSGMGTVVTTIAEEKPAHKAPFDRWDP